MINVKLGKSRGIELDDKKSTAILANNAVSIEGESYSAPGEYEARNIEVVFGSSAALIVWEKLQIIYLFKTTMPTDFEKSQFSSADVLVFATEESLSKKDVSALIDQYNPQVVIVSSKSAREDSLDSTLKLQETNLIKLSAANLPEEGMESYLVV